MYLCVHIGAYLCFFFFHFSLSGCVQVAVTDCFWGLGTSNGAQSTAVKANDV